MLAATAKACCAVYSGKRTVCFALKHLALVILIRQGFFIRLRFFAVFCLGGVFHLSPELLKLLELCLQRTLLLQLLQQLLPVLQHLLHLFFSHFLIFSFGALVVSCAVHVGGTGLLADNSNAATERDRRRQGVCSLVWWAKLAGRSTVNGYKSF